MSLSGPCPVPALSLTCPCPVPALSVSCPCPVLALSLAVPFTDNTLVNDRHFWSSSGSLTQVADEALLYRLEGPATRVALVQMAVYRAFYQHG